MQLPLSDFNLQDLRRELHGRALSIEGTKQVLYGRLLAARHEKAEAQEQGFVRSGRSPITKFRACVQPDDFAEIDAMTDEDYESFLKRMSWRLRRVHKLYSGNSDSLEYYHPGVLHRIDRSKSYVLQMSEFWVRQQPYFHKIFVVFVMHTNGEEHRLCYARSLAKLPSTELNPEQLKTPFFSSDDIGRVITNIWHEIENNLLENYVAIITDCNKIYIDVLKEVMMVTAYTLPDIVFDTGGLYTYFQRIFCSKSTRCLYDIEHELFLQSTYTEQLTRIQKNYNAENVNAVALIKQYLQPLPNVLLAMWRIEEHRGKQICLSRLNTERLSTYSAQVQNDFPPITFEECSVGGGLLQLIIFDVLWGLFESQEIEEKYPEPTADQPLSEGDFVDLIESDLQ